MVPQDGYVVNMCLDLISGGHPYLKVEQFVNGLIGHDLVSMLLSPPYITPLPPISIASVVAFGGA